MDPLTAGLIGSSIIGTGGALLQPQTGGEGLQPLAGVNPSDEFSRMLQIITGLSGTLANNAARPRTLATSFAQRLPSFSGGGLPIPIGVTGVDPALDNPALRTTQPLIFPEKNFFDFIPPSSFLPPGTSSSPASTASPLPSSSTALEPAAGAATAPEPSVQRPSIAPNAIPPVGGDSLQEAMSAIDLLLGAFKRPTPVTV